VIFFIFLFTLTGYTLLGAKLGRLLTPIIPLAAVLASLGFLTFIRYPLFVKSQATLSRKVGCWLILGTIVHNVNFILPIYENNIGGWKQLGAYLLTENITENIEIGDVYFGRYISDYALLSFYLKRQLPFREFKNGIYVCTGNKFRTPNEPYQESFDRLKDYARFKNKAFVFRPSLAAVGDWLLWPLWRYTSFYPRSLQDGDDELRVYSRNEL